MTSALAILLNDTEPLVIRVLHNVLAATNFGSELDRSFADFLVGNGLSAKTVTIYVKKIDAAIIWFADRGAVLAEASGADLAAWGSEQPPSTSSRRQARSAVSYYFEWLGRNTQLTKAIRVPPKPRYFCQAVTLLEAASLHRAALHFAFPKGTVVLAGLYLALRVHEIAMMRWDLFDKDFSRYTVTGKGTYTATLPVHDNLKWHLADLETPYPYLFPGTQGRAHVHPATVWTWVREVGETAGVADLRPHQLRHTAIATMHDLTGDLRTASEFARHRRVETTMIYSRTPEATLRKAVDQLHY